MGLCCLAEKISSKFDPRHRDVHLSAECGGEAGWDAESKNCHANERGDVKQREKQSGGI